MTTNPAFMHEDDVPAQSTENIREIVIPYNPRFHQGIIHKVAQRKQFIVPICHRRFGKTVMWLNEAIRRANINQRTDPPPRYSYVAPFKDQAKTIAWEYLKHFTRGLPGIKHHETELRADWAGGRRIRLWGGENADALRGQYNDGIGIDEYGQQSPKVWEEILSPTLGDYNGWAWIMGTPAGRNHFYKLKQKIESGDQGPDWWTGTFKASQTQVLSREFLERQKREISAERYEQEYECSFDAAIQGAYYANEIRQAREEERIVKRLPVEPLPAGFAFDLGIGDEMTIWVFQLVGREVRVLAYYQNTGQGLPHYVQWLERWRAKHNVPFWSDNNQIFPHDINVRELGTGRARIETLRELGLKPRALPITKVEEGINAVRMLMPRCWFDETNCAAGLDALSSYRKDWDEKKQTYNDRPLHDWASHAADGFRYVAQGLSHGSGSRGRGKLGYDNAGIV